MVKSIHRIIALSLLILTMAIAETQTPGINEVVVSGVVLNSATGQPLAKVPVRVQRVPDGDPVYAKANDQGRFEFRGLTPGLYLVEARLPGFLREGEGPNNYRSPRPIELLSTAPVLPSSPAPYTKTLEQGGILRGEVKLQLTPQAVLTGRITDPDGLPLAETQVEILTLRDAPPGGVVTGMPMLNGRMVTNASSAVTNDQGDYRAAALAPGAYLVRVSIHGMRFNQDRTFRTTFYPRTADLAAAQAIQFAAGQEARADIQIVRDAGVKISGRLVLPSVLAESKTSRYTNVWLISRQPNGIQQEYGAAMEDRYEAANLRPGTYELTAVTFLLNTNNPTVQTPLLSASRTVAIGSSDVTGPDLEMRPLPRLEATLRLADGCLGQGLQLSFSGGQGFPSTVQVLPGQTRIPLPPLLPGFQRLQFSGADGANLPVRSVKVQVGELPAQDNGFDTPTQDGTPIRIDIVCFNPGGVR